MSLSLKLSYSHVLYNVFSQDVDANEDDNSKEFSIAVKYEADLVIKGYVHTF